MARAPGFSIILAGGKGTRMGSTTCPKVCFPVDGVPAINRAITVYNECGVSYHTVVVGALAGHVVQTVGGTFGNVHFAYQAQQLGTAHAARIGLQALTAAGVEGDVLLVPGDRLVEPAALQALFEAFYSESTELAFLAGPAGAGSGRIVCDEEDRPLGIVEAPDIAQRRAYRGIRDMLAAGAVPGRDDLLALIAEACPEAAGWTDAKLGRAFGELWEALNGESRDVSRDELEAWVPADRTAFTFHRRDGAPVVLSPSEVAASPRGNVSIYLARLPALQCALEQLTRDNAQQEEYLTDIVAVLAGPPETGGPAGRAVVVDIREPDSVLGFNNPAELLEVETKVRERAAKTRASELPRSPWFRSLSDWVSAFAPRPWVDGVADAELRDELSDAYGNDPKLLAERVAACRGLLQRAGELLDHSAPVLLVRSPGRVNAMGRHVDHQGGNCNLMTIGFETLMAVHPREDDRVRLFNLDHEHYSDREFSIGELIRDLPWDDWLSLVDSSKVADLVRGYGGHWSQYVMAAVLRLQKAFIRRKLRGMDVIVSGNIPPAAGLSSSSSLVVGAAEATIAVNRLNTTPVQLVDLCGEGEWFVGTRGGSADHAAVKLGERGQVLKVRFFDFAIEQGVPFPPEMIMAVCDSGIRAQKSANARDQFNHRVSCYRIGFKLICSAFPHYAPLLEHLRDVNAERLGVPVGWIYRILLRLPEKATREDLQAMLPAEELAPLLKTHAEPSDGFYPLRGVVLFGLAECERSARFAGLLQAGRMADIGQLMTISHDGDRVARLGSDGRMHLFNGPTSNDYILNLMDDLESGNPERVLRAQLYRQPGRYHCSLPAIDRMVDLALQVDGVDGAQLAGAGLGGCMMVLLRRDALEPLREKLTTGYYEPASIEPRILCCEPIRGAGILMKPPD